MMKKVIKVTKRILLVFFIACGFTVYGMATAPISNCSCPAPTVTIVSHTSGAISFSWDFIDAATAYEVWYTRSEDSFISQKTNTTNNSIGFSNLPSGTYVFYFTSVCGGETSAIIIADDLIM